VARKPRQAGSTTANVVEHEAGALNIGKSRVGASFVSAGGNNFDAWRSGENRTDRPDQHGNATAQTQPGRWPPNVLFVHRSGCKVIGTRKVATGTAHRKNSGGRTIFSEGEKPPMEDMSYGGADGKETVPNWRCEHGCPVAELDRQSGELTSGSGTVKRASSAQRDGNVSASYGAESRADGEPQVWYGDTGGASRFFKGFGGQGSEG